MRVRRLQVSMLGRTQHDNLRPHSSARILLSAWCRWKGLYARGVEFFRHGSFQREVSCLSSLVRLPSGGGGYASIREIGRPAERSLLLRFMDGRREISRHGLTSRPTGSRETRYRRALCTHYFPVPHVSPMRAEARPYEASSLQLKDLCGRKSCKPLATAAFSAV
jgi:hypothetical protein